MKLLIALIFCSIVSGCTPNGPTKPIVYGVQLEKAIASAPKSDDYRQLPLEIDIEVAKSFVKTGYGSEFGLKFDSYDFRTQELRTKQAQELIQLIKEYRTFRGEQVAQAIGAFSGRVSSVSFGRELSPVVYVTLPHWTHQRELSPKGAERRKIDDSENDALVNELRKKFVDELGAKEFGLDRAGSRTIRIWWH